MKLYLSLLTTLNQIATPMEKDKKKLNLKILLKIECIFGKKLEKIEWNLNEKLR